MDISLTKNEIQQFIQAISNNKNHLNSDTLIANRVEELDGIRISFTDDTWILVRPSHKDPVMRVYLQANSIELLNEMQNLLKESIDRFINV
jgi:phosphomannomutase